MSGDLLDAFVSETPVRRAAILEYVSSFAASLPDGTRVMDAGAGVAPYRGLFSHCRYTTQDWSNSLHRSRPDVVGDLQSGIDLPAGSFDAILCTEVLEHVVDIGAAVAELHRLLTAGGCIAITIPFVMPLHEEPCDYWRATPYALTQILTGAGFGTVDVRPLTGVFSTLAEILSDLGYSVWPEGGSYPLTNRVIAKLARIIAFRLRKLWIRLDEHDLRKALPAGWSVTAVKDG